LGSLVPTDAWTATWRWVREMPRYEKSVAKSKVAVHEPPNGAFQVSFSGAAAAGGCFSAGGGCVV
jgi:hypothetical protein